MGLLFFCIHCRITASTPSVLSATSKALNLKKESSNLSKFLSDIIFFKFILVSYTINFDDQHELITEKIYYVFIYWFLSVEIVPI